MEAMRDAPVTSWMKASQVGATELAGNGLGYYVEHEPSDALVVHPVTGAAETWSKEKFSSLLETTPALRGILTTAREHVAGRRGGDSVATKFFATGASVVISGANSPNGISGRTVRIVVLDDLDRFPAKVGRDGDPQRLAERRNSRHPRSRTWRLSSPTEATSSRIADSYATSSRGKWHVPCPHCGHRAPMEYDNVRIPPDGELEERATAARYACPECEETWEEPERYRAMRAGAWVHERPENPHRGFHTGELLLAPPLSDLASIVRLDLEAQATPDGGGAEQVFRNTVLGLPWELRGETTDPNVLYRTRREHYGEPLPPEILVITAGVDVQRDRIEVEVVGWARNRESWSLAYHVINGDPSGPETTVWRDLDELLAQTWATSSGWRMPVTACGIDSGDQTDAVYGYARPRITGIPAGDSHAGADCRVYPLKGDDGRGLPAIVKSTKPKGRRIRLWYISRETGIDRLHGRLAIEEPGPGYMHFPLEYPEAWFEGLAGSKRVTVISNGRPVQTWRPKRLTQPLEPQDARRAADAALEIRAPSWRILEERYSSAPEDAPAPVSTAAPRRVTIAAAQSRGGARGRRRGGYNPGAWRN